MVGVAKTLSFDGLILKAARAAMQASDDRMHMGDEQALLCIAAARTYLNRAEYSLRNGGVLKSSDNELADMTIDLEHNAARQ